MTAMRGRIWEKVVTRAELEEVRLQHELLSSRLATGRTVIHILSDTDPGEGFVAVPAGLEDVYFATMADARRTSAPDTAKRVTSTAA